MTHKSGFVNIIGNPNVGKSTLMNALVGEKISIITSKSQTTRHRILGIVNSEDFQIVYSDTPGFIKPHYKLQEAMVNFSVSALQDADILLYVTDVYEKDDKNTEFRDKVIKHQAPVIIVINKIDLSTQEKVQELIDKWQKIAPNAHIIPTSAQYKFNLDTLFDKIIELLPEGPAYFPKDSLTDKTERFFVEEIVREKILKFYSKEIPYSTQVIVEEFKEYDDIIKIRLNIFVERESQKPIIIGSKGAAIKKVGTEARKDLEDFFDKKIFLDMHVKVAKNWRTNDQKLKQFGYE